MVRVSVRLLVLLQFLRVALGQGNICVRWNFLSTSKKRDVALKFAERCTAGFALVTLDLIETSLSVSCACFCAGVLTAMALWFVPHLYRLH